MPLRMNVLGLACGLLGCSPSDSAPPSTLLTREAMLDPVTCKGCHLDHFSDWSTSMHAYAADDPVFLAMNERGQRETGGQLGPFCVNCHAPMAVREGATKDGRNLASVPQKLKGVTCFFCHSVESIDGTHNDPLKLSNDLVMRGPFGDPVASSAHAAAYSPVHDRQRLEASALCGSCHDIVTDANAAIERTYAEWQGSVFSHAPGGTTCAQCHMAESKTLRPVAQAPGAIDRRYHAHTFAGVDTALTPWPGVEAQKKEIEAFLDTTVQSALCVTAAGEAQVILDNVGAGHGFPSGSAQDRRLWVEVVAYAAGNVVYASGKIPDGASVTASADPDLWLLRDCMFDASGKQVSLFSSAASFESNTLPAQSTFDQADPKFYQTHVFRSFPRTGAITPAPDRVTMRLRLQAIGVEVLDELVESGDLDPAVRSAMSTLTVGQQVEWTPSTATKFVDHGAVVSCVTLTNLNAQADKVPASERALCKP